MSLKVYLRGKSRIVVKSSSAVEPCSVHMADEEGVEVGFHERAGLLYEGRVNDLDPGNGGIGHRRGVARAALLWCSGRGGHEG